jgi:hypothetical protein
MIKKNKNPDLFDKYLSHSRGTVSETVTVRQNIAG